MSGTKRELEFVHPPLFDAAARDLLDDEARRQVEVALLVEPRAGDLVAGTGGVRKLRAALPGRGKRGGARVIHLYVEVRGRIYFLLAYAKNEQVDLTPGQKKALRTMAKQIGGTGMTVTGKRNLAVLLVDSMAQAVAIETGRLRAGLGLSQPVFAKALNVSVGTVRSWEQGARIPDGPSRRLLDVVERHPQAILDVVRDAR